MSAAGTTDHVLTIQHARRGLDLQASIDSAQDSSAKALLQEHLDQSPHQRENLERVFAAFGWEVDDSPCPTIEAIEKEGKATAKRTDDVQYHEIGVYENLIHQRLRDGQR